MKRILISLVLLPLTMMAMGPRSYTMRSQPDNDRTVDLKLTWRIISDDIWGDTDHLPDSDPRVIASYCAIFRGCKNGISNLAPATATYIKNSQGYILTPIIQSMACEKHVHSTALLQWITQKDDKIIEKSMRLNFGSAKTLTCQDPTNPSLFMRILLSEITDDADKK